MLSHENHRATGLSLGRSLRIAAFALGMTMAQTSFAQHEHHEMHEPESGPMKGLLGAPMTREATGTSWQPDATPHMGGMHQKGDWHLMMHGSLDAVYTDLDGPRGESETFGAGMFMAAAQRAWGVGSLGFRGMLSPDALLMHKDGYPLLLQTGETADGHEPLIDRQHPHDLLMELAVAMSRPVDEHGSAFLYLALPGEPALGPPAFMHRFSGMANPEAPLSHHWLDSTHITFGVVTAGYQRERWKIEASAFNGREPDEDRYDIEVRRLSSASVRLSFNPTEHWSLQVSRGRLKSPEQLEPEVDADRTSASVSHHRVVPSLGGAWQTTFAWGRNAKEPGTTTDALVLESAMQWRQAHTIFSRYEHVEKDELFGHHDPGHGQIFEVGKLSLGYLHTWSVTPRINFGLGAVVSQHFTPRSLDVEYGSDPQSFTVFARLSLL